MGLRLALGEVLARVDDEVIAPEDVPSPGLRSPVPDSFREGTGRRQAFSTSKCPLRPTLVPPSLAAPDSVTEVTVSSLA
jgi:hypothetical protein